MSVNPKRLRALPIAVMALAIPLMAPSAANAALAGANPSTTTLLPDLRSATVTNVSATDATTIRVCFNKTIASVPTAGAIFVGGYRTQGQEIPADNATRVGSAQNCLDAVWNTTDIDATQRTYVRVASGAVANLANGFVNLPDSTPLIGSTTRNGTRGKAVAPDLEGATLNIGANAINYVFDQRIGNASNVAACYTAILQDGTLRTALGGAGNVSFSGNVVIVSFAAGNLGTPGNPVVRAIVHPTCVNDKRGIFNIARMSVAMPGTGGISNDPDLVAVNLSADGNTADFVFDENIIAGPNINAAFPSGEQVTDSGAVTVSGTPTAPAPTIVNNNTVRVAINPNFHEYLVWGFVGPDVVRAQVGGAPNEATGVPAGGNAGAFAIGFTTAPDVMSVALDNATGVVNIRLDQRFGSFSAPCIRLVDDAGALIPGSPTSVAGQGGPAQQVIAQAQFTPGQVTGARSVAIGWLGDYPGCGIAAFTGSIGWFSPSQVVSPTAAAKYARKNGKVVRRSATVSKAARKAAMRRAFKRA